MNTIRLDKQHAWWAQGFAVGAGIVPPDSETVKRIGRLSQLARRYLQEGDSMDAADRYEFQQLYSALVPVNADTGELGGNAPGQCPG